MPVVDTTAAAGAPVIKASAQAAVASLVETVKVEGASVDAVVALVQASFTSSAKADEAAAFFAAIAEPILAEDKKAAPAALAAVKNMATSGGVVLEPFLAPLLAPALKMCGHKDKKSKVAANAAVEAIAATLSNEAVAQALEVLVIACEDQKQETKCAALAAIGAFVARAPKQISAALPELIPVLTSVVHDTKVAVKVAAEDSLKNCSLVVTNDDVKPFLPALCSAVVRPDETAECLHKLAGTTFLQTVTAPALSLLAPVLIRGLREGSTPAKRQAALIIDNMSKLVEDPVDAQVFLPKLLPGLEYNAETVSDPECRTISERARDTLRRINQETQGATLTTISKEKALKSLSAAVGDAGKASPMAAQVVTYVSRCGLGLNARRAAAEEWEPALLALLAPLCGAGAAAVIATFAKECGSGAEEEDVDEDSEEGEELCNCSFSLAYGSKILLNNAKLRLKRGRRYGLVGPNGSGKSTLLRAIANGQVEGFPDANAVRTVFVEHDIMADQETMNVIEFVEDDKLLKHIPREEIIKTLSSVGFNDVMQTGPVTSLSGGWKMKLALARAILKNADILLLDEPTNHLDVANVAWVCDYLNSLTECTSILVSHDSGFLDRVCTHIIQCDHLKLRKYKGNLTEFVKQVPEAKAYHELKASSVTFTFPEPGFLEGVKSKGRAILKMKDVSFSYPGHSHTTVRGINISVSMNSRCAVVGPNGAGKSTMIKLLTGELTAATGECYKHPNLVMAYVAQHAFHHIENHLQKTPSEYIQWRFQGGEDQEGLNKITRQVTPEEQAVMDQKVTIEGIKNLVIKKLVNRRAYRNTFEYECTFEGLSPSANMWVKKDKLIKLGWEKPILLLDDKELARTNGSLKALTGSAVEEHCRNFGLEAEHTNHTRIEALSTSQKVKVVLAACTWQNPQIIVLDEPTNYLDRESLGALADAIRVFGGGVIMISHNNEFTSALCPETWAMDAGNLTPYGHVEEKGEAIEEKIIEEAVDGMGNTIKIKNKKSKDQMTRKEKKAWEKRRAAKIAAGEELSSDEED